MKRFSLALLTLLIFAPFPAQGQRLAVPERGAYNGAYLCIGDTEDTLTSEMLRDFELLVGRQQAIVAFSSFWGQKSFPNVQVRTVRDYGAVPLIFWSPWGPPYRQNELQPEYSLDRILEGRFDGYLREWAREARMAEIPLLVSFGLEANGDWFPWGGSNQGGGATRGFGDPKKPDGPERYIAAYRHVVRIVREAGARNIQWVYHAQNYSWPVAPWNTITAYYPGDDVVDWLGLSVYGKQSDKEGWLTFDTVMRYPYSELARLDKTKPIMLAEWGVGEFPRDGSKADFFDEAFAAMAKDYPRLRAAVYWHERWENADETWSNLRVNSSPKALAAFRRGMRLPFWVGRPAIVP
ncbi:MAG: beta-mannanase [Verrucomicrobiae bacterium]|nr:beta-mannanase [Verrucomicrobiae bacterium]